MMLHGNHYKKDDDSDSVRHDPSSSMIDPGFVNPFSPMSITMRNRRVSPPTYGNNETDTQFSTTMQSPIYMYVDEVPDHRQSRPASSNNADTSPSHAYYFEIEDDTNTNFSIRQNPYQHHQHFNNYHHVRAMQTIPQNDTDDLLGMGLEPMRTSSGLQLTHRQSNSSAVPSSDRLPSGFDTDWRRHNRSPDSDPYAHASNSMLLPRKWLHWTKLWIAISCSILLLGTVIILWHRGEESVSDEVQQTRQATDVGVRDQQIQEEHHPYDKILLLPLNSATTNNLTSTSSRRTLSPPATTRTLHKTHKPDKKHGVQGALHELRDEFEAWVLKHEKKYHSHDEKERRFHIWTQNHDRTREKNERHGPCRMTKQPVFGSNIFKDLSPEEFQQQFLTGYKGPTTDQLHPNHEIHRPVLEERPLHSVNRHPKVQAAYDEKLHHRLLASYSGSCTWYDVSCWLRWFVNKYGYAIGNTMEPSSNYPDAVDWREMGVVSDVHSQGNCGACWAITAVETVESAYAIAKGTLVDLAESEVIICDTSCELCEGGWPQNAYEYVMANGGLPPEKTMSYDGDYLLALTYAKTGESDTYTEAFYEEVLQNVCPSDKNDKNDNNGVTRYANIKGYGYATDRCVCYTDGSGCDCDNQNEQLALQNVATWGPATVCLEASLWQDYAGGIITTDLGCSSAFLDMNHCVQAVGYVFTDGDDDDGENENSNSRSRDSKDNRDREGYWIIRNQWSSSWGMYGYAYVAMGSNTCGILNDITIVYM